MRRRRNQHMPERIDPSVTCWTKANTTLMHYLIDFLERTSNIISANIGSLVEGCPPTWSASHGRSHSPQHALWATERNEGVSMANQVTIRDAPQLNEIQVICKIVVCHL